MIENSMAKQLQLAQLPPFYLIWKEVIQNAVKQKSLTFY